MGLIDRDRPVLAAIQIVLLSVALVVALLLSVGAYYSVQGYRDHHRSNPSRVLVESLYLACVQYRQDHGVFPPAEPYEGSANLHFRLGRSDSRQGPYLELRSYELEGQPARTNPDPPRRIVDLWGRPIRYVVPGKHNPKGVDIWSEGPDPKSPDDDIGNWETD